MENTNQTTQNANQAAQPTKFCKECGEKISAKAVICPKCGCQVEDIAKENPQIVINNSNQNQNINTAETGKKKSKWVALLLWFFLGVLGGHKFYEGKVGMGILYIFTFGLFGIGLLVDFFVLLFKPNPYYV